jgi:hypothetical protein
MEQHSYAVSLRYDEKKSAIFLFEVVTILSVYTALILKF